MRSKRRTHVTIESPTLESKSHITSTRSSSSSRNQHPCHHCRHHHPHHLRRRHKQYHSSCGIHTSSVYSIFGEHCSLSLSPQVDAIFSHSHTHARTYICRYILTLFLVSCVHSRFYWFVSLFVRYMFWSKTIFHICTTIIMSTGLICTQM